MNSDFELVLEDCLKRLRDGQSPEDCLAAYPDEADGLRPLLLLAGHIRVAPAPQPRLQAIRAGRARMLAAVQSTPARNSFAPPVSSGTLSRYTVRIFTHLRTLLFRKVTHDMTFALRLALALVVILVCGAVLAVNASASSLPGDPLYGVKRTWEEVRLTLTLNVPARQQFQDQIRQLRLEEVREMIRMGKTGTVEFVGQLESIAADEWVVSGIPVRMLPDTMVEGDPAVGQTILVQARLQGNGVVTAWQTRVLAQGQPPAAYPEPLPSHTPAPTPWPTQEPTLAPASGPTPMPWPTASRPGTMPVSTPWPNQDHQNRDNCGNCDNNNHRDDHNMNNMNNMNNDYHSGGGW